MQMKLSILLAIPRSFLINIILFGIRGGCIPLIISNRVKVKGIKRGKIKIHGDYNKRILFGFGGTEGICGNRNSYLIIGNEGIVEFYGKAFFGAGSSIRCDHGTLKFGNNFWCNKNCFFSCSEGISFGDDVLLGWNVNIRDTDGHDIVYDQARSDKNSHNHECQIGNHVWLASCVDILKGVSIPSGSVVSYRSCVTKTFYKERSLIAGYPAKVIRENIEWRR